LDYQRHPADRFRSMWGTFTAMWGAMTFPVGHDSGHVGQDSVDERFLPHIPAESRPTSQRNPAPLQMESVPHLDRNTQLTPSRPSATSRRQRMRAGKAVLDINRPVELAVLSVKQKAARCRLLGSGIEVTLRATGLWNVVPGEIAVVRPNKQWTYAGNPYLSGKIESTRLDVGALDLIPLKLEARGVWDPAQEYWGEEGEPVDDWAKPIIARGQRPQFEMEQVLPGMDPDDPDPDADPIGQAVDCNDSGDREGAYKILMGLCQADLRCLDAHAHLGNMVFDGRPEDAIRHYEAGFRIGELCLGKRFEGLLPWGWIDNRPFLRCMHGFGLCLWRLRRFREAGNIFSRMLWLNPSDNQGVRFVAGEVAANVVWEESQNR